MKKLLIAFAAVAMATCVHASAVAWGTGAIYKPTDATAKIGEQTGDYVMTLTFFAYNNTEKTWNEMTGITGASQDSTAKASKFKNTTSDSFVGGTTYGVVAEIVTDGYMLTTDMAEFVASGTGNTSIDFSDATTFSKAVTLNSLSRAGTPGTWNASAIPEPTSGLLLLLGMAGLALRRRRA